jgi:hypothetical protein
LFPFIHNGITYHQCTTDSSPVNEEWTHWKGYPDKYKGSRAWCPINLETGPNDPDGITTTDKYYDAGLCNQNCPGYVRLRKFKIYIKIETIYYYNLDFFM